MFLVSLVQKIQERPDDRAIRRRDDRQRHIVVQAPFFPSLAGELSGPRIDLYRAVGKIVELEKKVQEIDLPGTCGIAHTRWATHGEPTEENAHPHRDQAENVFVIHNGIIENYYTIRKRLEKSGVLFRSQTDTEVMAHLIALNFEGDLAEAVRKTMSQVEGTFGIAVIHRKRPNEIVIARRGSPLIIGVGEDGNFAASDVSAMVRYTNQVVHLNDNELATLTAEGYDISTAQAKIVTRHAETVEWQPEDAELNGFPHFMLKEIFEQPETVLNAIRGRLELGEGVPKLGGIIPVWDRLKECRHLVIVACGTSYHAGCVGRYVFERLTEIDVEVEIASEFRYRKLNFPPNTFIIAISQSGETADTLAALREAQGRKARVLAICNVVGSSVARESDSVLYTRAGIEIGVASTKAFTAQLAALSLLGIHLGLARERLSARQARDLTGQLQAVPEALQKVLVQRAAVAALAERFAASENFLYLGRGIHYPVALEGALKLKEISYIHAEGYPAGEMKHGPIALIDPRLPVVVLAPWGRTYEKVVSNIEEVKARRGIVIALACEGDCELDGKADHILHLPYLSEFVAPILEVVPLQLLAYHIGVRRGCDVDQPRNLAKSVTVE